MPAKFQLVYMYIYIRAYIRISANILSFSLFPYFSPVTSPLPPSLVRRKEEFRKISGECVKIEGGRRLAGTCYAGANYRVGRAGCARIRGSGERTVYVAGRSVRYVRKERRTREAFVLRLPGQLTRAALIFNRV